MAKARIFLSSTCYDLRALREHIRDRIEELGHELLASEYPSFPVAPDLSTVENCKKVVREHADLFVLVVGGRRGSLDPSGTRSVVNSEYLEARSRGIDCFVFIDKQVWDLLPIYEKTPSADFTPVVDHPEVFKFVAKLKAHSRWIYTFTRTDDIIGTLRTQLSIYLRTLIERGRADSLVVPREFASDSRSVIALIQERPKFWEYLLTAELLDQAVAGARRGLEELDQGILFRAIESVGEKDAMGRVHLLLRNMTNIATAFEPTVALIMPAWGPKGTTGNPVEIRQACGKVNDLLKACIAWETELRFIDSPEQFAPLFHALRGSTREILDQVATVAPSLRTGLQRALADPGECHVITIQLMIGTPSTFERFHAEMEKLKRHYNLW